MNKSTPTLFDPFKKAVNVIDGMCVIYGNVPSKSNCYNIVTFKAKKPEGKTLYSIEQRDRIMALFHDGDWDAVRDELNKNDDGSKKSHATLAKTTELKHYEQSFSDQCGYYAGKNIEGAFKIELVVFYPSRRADLDNSLKIVLDCLQANSAIKNDRNCEEIHAKRKVDKDNPRIEFKLTTL